MKLDPVAPRWIAPDGRIIAEVSLIRDHPARVIRKSITPGASR